MVEIRYCRKQLHSATNRGRLVGDRSGERPQRHLANYGSILQADAYAGFNALYKDDRPLGPITEAACWAHVFRSCRHCNEGQDQ